MVKCLIVDDDSLMIHILESLLIEFKFIHIVDKVSCVNEAIDVLNNEQIDVIFLDIEMPKINGIEFLKNFNDLNSKVVIISSHEKYALEAIELRVLDYLLKPIERLRLLKTLNFIKTTFNDKENKFHDSIYVRQNLEYKLLLTKDIYLIESKGDYIQFQLKSKKITSHSTLKKVMNKLPSNDFVRIHNCFIVNINYIETITEGFIVVHEKMIPIGRTYKTAVLNRINLL
ncbi:MAG: response regulator transcription factor [Flavobacteriia bacterium]|nr:response regulator transcription factor [Flavobacteriia bacterium]